jgi:hypothetical protein
MYVIFQQETIQAVYNWQFVQSLHLWTEVLGVTAHRPHLQPMLYPLVQVTSLRIDGDKIQTTYLQHNDSVIIISTLKSILESNLTQIACSKDKVSIDHYKPNR